MSEWFEVKPKEIEKLFQEIKTPVVNILKLHKTSDYLHKRKQRIKNSNHITEIKIKQKEIKNKMVCKFFEINTVPKLISYKLKINFGKVDPKKTLIKTL